MRSAFPCARSLRRAFTLLELLVVIVILAALASLVVPNVGRTTEDAEIVAARVVLHTLAEAFTGSGATPGYLADMRYAPGFRPVNARIHDLFSPSSYPAAGSFDPATQRGWRGEYVRNSQGVQNTNAARQGAFPASDDRRFDADSTFQTRGFFSAGGDSPYGIPGDRAAADPWGNPIVLQIPPADTFAGSTGDAKRFRYARLVSAGADGILSTPLDRLGGRTQNGDFSVRGDDLVLFLNRSDLYEPEEP